MDVHAETITAAIVEPDGEVRSLGTIANREDSIRKFIRKLGPVEQLRACYEAGPTGFVLYWQLAQLGVQCVVVAPSLVPKKPGDRVKTDRRDAIKLARSHRSGDLTAVWVPDENSEALRDLVRQREAAKQDQLRARHWLTKFLLRTGWRPPLGLKAWTERYLAWLQQVRYTQPAQQATLVDCLNEVQHMSARVKRLEEAILEVMSNKACIQKELGGLPVFATTRLNPFRPHYWSENPLGVLFALDIPTQLFKDARVLAGARYLRPKDNNRSLGHRPIQSGR